MSTKQSIIMWVAMITASVVFAYFAQKSAEERCGEGKSHYNLATKSFECVGE